MSAAGRHRKALPTTEQAGRATIRLILLTAQVTRVVAWSAPTRLQKPAMDSEEDGTGQVQAHVVSEQSALSGED